MSDLKEMAAAAPEIWRSGGGLALGLLFGAIAQRSGFCTMGAVSDIVNLSDWGRMRGWLLAMLVALAGTQALAMAGVCDLARSIYLAPRLTWASHLLGGTLFGIGMVLAGGCAARNLVRAGSGDVRALVTLMVMGIAGHASLGGLIGPLRAALERATAVTIGAPTQGLDSLLAQASGLDGASARTGIMLFLIVPGALFCLSGGASGRRPRYLVAGASIGLIVAAGWAITGLAYDELMPRPLPAASLSFVRPAGDTLDWLQRFTAGPLPGFGVASVIGTILGALAVALATGSFRVTGFVDTGDTLRNLGGAVLMGVGGVMALGCTMGQGITGLSTLAVGSLLTVLAIVAGAVCGFKILEQTMA